MKLDRAQEIMGEMKSFDKAAYYRDELLPEMLKLQAEMVYLTFNEDHALLSNLKIQDIEEHLTMLNEQSGNAAGEELQRFKATSKDFCNLIRAEISGNRGESKAFNALERMKSEKIVLKNIELMEGDCRTELDAVVITPAVITIVEVKNTAKNVFIDDNGNYYRSGEFSSWDCDIAGKMKLKEKLLRKALAEKGLEDIRVEGVVVFTNRNIEIQNYCPSVRTCFLSQLPYIIDGFRSECALSKEQMLDVKTAVEDAACHEAYPFEFDVQQYKWNFAELMAILELTLSAVNPKDAECLSDDVLSEKKPIEAKPASVAPVETSAGTMPVCEAPDGEKLIAMAAVEGRPAEAGLAETVPVEVKSVGKTAARKRHMRLHLAEMVKPLLSSGKAGKTGTTAAVAVIAGTAAATIAIAGAAAAITVAAVRRGQAA